MLNHVERAFRAWPVLTKMAKQSEPTITYGDLAASIGIHHRAVRYVLGVIQDHCLAEKLPPLTILVVNAGSDRPGPGFVAWDADDLPAGIAQVQHHPWDRMTNPFSFAADGTTEEQLAQQIIDDPSRAADVYAAVKVRGAAQSIFRKALLKAYFGKCSICGFSFEEALEAAHLIPWSEATAAQRMSPDNGLLLCATHHKLFDSGIITITANYQVVHFDPEGMKGDYGQMDHSMTIDLHGKKARVPKDQRHRPSRLALSRHHEIKGWDL